MLKAAGDRSRRATSRRTAAADGQCMYKRTNSSKNNIASKKTSRKKQK